MDAATSFLRAGMSGAAPASVDVVLAPRRTPPAPAACWPLSGGEEFSSTCPPPPPSSTGGLPRARRWTAGRNPTPPTKTLTEIRAASPEALMAPCLASRQPPPAGRDRPRPHPHRPRPRHHRHARPPRRRASRYPRPVLAAARRLSRPRPVPNRMTSSEPADALSASSPGFRRPSPSAPSPIPAGLETAIADRRSAARPPSTTG